METPGFVVFSGIFILIIVSSGPVDGFIRGHHFRGHRFRGHPFRLDPGAGHNATEVSQMPVWAMRLANSSTWLDQFKDWLQPEGWQAGNRGKLRSWLECQPEENDCLNNSTCFRFGVRHCLCPDGFSGTRCENTTDVGDRCVFQCVRHCQFGYVLDPATECYQCKCAADPCQKFKCGTKEVCELHRQPCSSFPCPPPAPGCKSIDDEASTCDDVTHCTSGCKFGPSVDTSGCPTCQCRADPCKSVKCGAGRQCVMESLPCFGNNYGCHGNDRTWRAVCRSEKKPGECPDYEDYEHYEDNYDYSGSGDYSGGSVVFPSDTNHVDSRSPCLSMCTSDVNCTGLTKCCATECGRSCMMPTLTSQDQCRLERNEAIESGTSWYVPECDQDDLYRPMQCQTLEGQDICYCVDPQAGTYLPGTFNISSSDGCKDVLSRHICRPLTHCRLACDFGLAVDTMGCQTCSCAEDPCSDKASPCGPELVCERMSRPYCPSCPPMIVCLEPKWSTATCESGLDPKRANDLSLALCSLSDEEKEHSCPPGHGCVRIHSFHALIGVCCPVADTNQAEKPGSCPASTSMPNVCREECTTDMDCDGDLKCCAHICGSQCHIPQVNMNSTCQQRLEDAMLQLKLMPGSPVFIPRCQIDGAWFSVQCHESYGVCWCVRSDGSRRRGTQVRGVPDCSADVPDGAMDEPVCPSNSAIHACPSYMCSEYIDEMENCSAACRINPCGSCTVEFFDGLNRPTKCLEEMSSCQRHVVETRKIMENDQDEIDMMYHMTLDYLHRYRSGITNGAKDPLLNAPFGSRGAFRGKRSLSRRPLPLYWMTLQPATLRSSQRRSRDRTTFVRRKRSSGGQQRYTPTGFESAMERGRHVIGRQCPASRYLTKQLGDMACLQQCQYDEDCQDSLVCCPTTCGHVCAPETPSAKKCFDYKPQRPEDCLMDSQSQRTRYTTTRWFFNTDTLHCESYTYLSECDSSSQNSFYSERSCQEQCLGVYPMKGTWYPKCQGSQYSTMQCVDGLCWCSLPNGTAVPGTLTTGDLICDSNGQMVREDSGIPGVCPDGKQPKICQRECLDEYCYLDNKRDTPYRPYDGYYGSYGNYKNVYCEADPCNNCSVSQTIYDSAHDGKAKCHDKPSCEAPMDTGTCTESLPRWFHNTTSRTCQRFIYSGCGGNLNVFESESQCQKKCRAVLCPHSSKVKVCDDACVEATCPKVPEAICTADPCSCDAIFVDPLIGHVVDCAIARTLCERMRIEKEKIRMLTPAHASSIHVPHCEADGTFGALQCSTHHETCWCVNDMGQVIPGSRRINGTDQPPSCDKIKTTAVHLSFKFSNKFESIAEDLPGFKRELRSSLSERIQVPDAHITKLQVAPGSIRITCDILAAEGNDLASEISIFKSEVIAGQYVFEFKSINFTVQSANMTTQLVHNKDNATTFTTHADHSHHDHAAGTHNMYDVIITVSVVLAIIALAILAVVAYMIVRRHKRQDAHDTVGFSNQCFENETAAHEAVIHSSGVTLDYQQQPCGSDA